MINIKYVSKHLMVHLEGAVWLIPWQSEMIIVSTFDVTGILGVILHIFHNNFFKIITIAFYCY